MNYQGLYHMSEKEMVVGVPKLSNVIKVCPSCKVGKQYREQFQHSQTIAT